MGVRTRVPLVRLAVLSFLVVCMSAVRAECQTRERPSVLKWVHIDAFWIPLSDGGGQSSLGLIGTHIALANIGRVYVYSAPGVLVLHESKQPGWALRVHMTWGVSVYLTDVHVPSMRRTAQLYLNLANVGGRDDQPGMQMAGLSVTWKK
jgi:hypothetical protein